MKHPVSNAARFQINVTAPRPRQGVHSADTVHKVVLNWLDGIETEGWSIRVAVWSHGRKREITEIDDSPRGEVLALTLRRALHDGRLRVKALGYRP